MKDEDNDRLKQVIDTGSNVIGAATGNLLGFLLADAPGAALGGAIGASVTGVIKQVTLDVLKRTLSHREEIRIAATTAYITNEVQNRLNSGENLRNDDFFVRKDDNSSSNAEEIFEGVLLKSKNQNQEKKIKFISGIFTNAAFQDEISVAEANHILQVVENITYRQMCLLSLFERKNELEDINLLNISLSEMQDEEMVMSIDLLSILQETFQLHSLGLIARSNVVSEQKDSFVSGGIGYGVNYEAMFGLDDVAPNRMVLTNLGKRYFSIMNLSEIPIKDLKEVAMTLSE
jgi:hypothetical protein